jgi:dephospho-CoA kinase
VPRIGLTGGIGAGKSTVATILVSLGGVLIDADKVAREVVEPGTPGLDRVIERFGRGVVLPDGSLDRPALGRVVFGDDEALRDLNAIVHPLVGARMAEIIGALRDDDVQIHDIPLLVDNGLTEGFDKVVVVETPLELRLERLVATRPQLTRADALAVIAKQVTDEQRRAVADIVIVNDGTQAELRVKVEAIWPQLVAA